MSRHLKDAVGRRVDDRLARPHVFNAQLLDNLGSGRRAIAERAAADAAFERFHDLGRKAARVERKWLRQMDPDHLPVSGGGVLARRGEGTFSEGRGWPIDGSNMLEGFQIA